MKAKKVPNSPPPMAAEQKLNPLLAPDIKAIKQATIAPTIKPPTFTVRTGPFATISDPSITVRNPAPTARQS